MISDGLSRDAKVQSPSRPLPGLKNDLKIIIKKNIFNAIVM